MSFSPQEIENKDFLITLRGYDKEEVKAFLKTLAADYAEAVEAAGKAPSGEHAYKAWSKEMAGLLQQAEKAADQITQKAMEEAGASRARAEDEATRLREAARNAAARATEEAENHAAEVRAEADRYAREVRTAAESDATERLEDVTRRVERLRATEDNVRTRLTGLETMLSSMRQDLRPEEGTEVIDISEENPRQEEGSGQSIPEGRA